MQLRYGSKEERERNRIPDCIRYTLRLSGEKAISSQIDGRFHIRMTDDGLEFIDTAGAVVVCHVSRGLIREFSAEVGDVAREESGYVQQETDEQRAQRIERSNHLWRVGQGHNYRCQFCGKESPAVLWADMHTCPLCGCKYDAIMAADEEE